MNNEDIWVENLTGEGKPYYYHLHTRETRWDRPQNAKILTQQEVDNMGNQNSSNGKLAHLIRS